MAALFCNKQRRLKVISQYLNSSYESIHADAMACKRWEWVVSTAGKRAFLRASPQHGRRDDSSRSTCAAFWKSPTS
jgi:hypothetical protein